MSEKIWAFLLKILLLLLSLRYRIEIKGLDKLKKMQFKRPGGLLFLPNHPAHMDPFFLFLLLWPRYRMRPLAIEYIHRLPILKPFLNLVGAIAIPNFDTSSSQIKVKKAEEAMHQVVEGLKKGGNFCLYPAGQLKSTAKEVVGGSSGVHTLLEKCPDANIVLVRTTGLWGSVFSRAFTGKTPDLPKMVFFGIKTLFKNGLFFCPRREVSIEIELEPEDFPRGQSRIEVNRYLENWYNRYPAQDGKILEEEPLSLVSYAFWKKEIPEILDSKKERKGLKNHPISEETKTKIYEEIRKILSNPNIAITPEKSLSLDLGMDSLNIAEMIAYLAQNYEVGELHPEDVDTVQHVLEIAEGKEDKKGISREFGTAVWPKEEERPLPALPLGETIPEAFLASSERMGSFAACGDDLIGVVSYKKLKQAVLVLASHFKEKEGEKIAIMLPASIGAYIVILAIQIAGKIPVMLNWTLGPRYLEGMMERAQAKNVVSSWKFLDRLSHVDLGKLIDQIEFLEDIRQKLTLKTKLKGALLAKCPKSWVMRAFGLSRIKSDAPAVILFTSGTEAEPKGVPLSHKNILSNLRSAMQCIEVGNSDVLYGILPPFHSFGFSVAGLFPILSGIKVAFYPDPTDSFALAEGIQRWNITFFCSAPSFLKGLFSAAKPGQLKTVRLFVSGAEKAPSELFERVKELGGGAKLVEGYGITECSPILTLNRPNLPPKGVGRLLPGVELITIHPETSELLAQGAEGEICVRGDNVFQGYLANPKSPFIEIEGKQWYRTGDIGYLDPDGSLILSGRLKRFTKIGGEMVSLGAVEEVLVEALLSQGKISSDKTSLAVIAKEAEKPQLILFSTIDIGQEEVNEILQNSGLSRLLKISEVRKIKEIPILGTGKTNYQSLQKEVEK